MRGIGMAKMTLAERALFTGRCIEVGEVYGTLKFGDPDADRKGMSRSLTNRRGARGFWGACALVFALRQMVLAADPPPLPEPDAPWQFTNRVDRFAVTLPAGWKSMPAELAEGLSDPGLAAKPGGVGAYGFELAGNTNSLTPPYVTIQVVRAGR